MSFTQNEVRRHSLWSTRCEYETPPAETGLVLLAQVSASLPAQRCTVLPLMIPARFVRMDTDRKDLRG